MATCGAKGSEVHFVIDTPGHLLALRITSVETQDRAEVGASAAAVQEVTDETFNVAFVDQDYTGD
jgi:hypothetical protein